MSWMKNGDNAATYPALMSVAGMEGSDERAINETAGFLWRAATLAAAHRTDYGADMGTLYMLGGSRTEIIISWCERAGLMTKVEEGGLTSYSIIADPEFIHMRLRDEIEWERQQRADTRDPRLTVPVRLRDGDNCRWCGVSVTWRGRTSNSSGEYDHLIPGTAATIETLVVACRSCNGARKGGSEEQLAAWEETHPLRPAPASPRYGKSTAKYLQDNGHPHITENIRSDEEPARPASAQAADAQRRTTGKAAANTQRRPVEQAADAQRRAAGQAADSTNANAPENMPPNIPRNSNSHSDGMNFVGSGRDGTGRVSTDSAGSMPAWAGNTWPSTQTTTDGTQTPKPRRRRGKRGGNKR